MQKILIIEDDADIASIERDYLELNGCQVEIAADGASGLARGRSGEFDLILLDLMLRSGRLCNLPPASNGNRHPYSDGNCPSGGH